MMNALIVSLLLSSLTIEVTRANGLLNGDFEIPATDGANYATPPEGFGWQLVPGTDFDLMRTYWQPSSGAQSLDLNGFTAGSLYQDFSFDASGNWTISYDLSAAPTGPSSKTVQVDFGLADGPLTTLGTYTIDATTRTTADMQWRTFASQVSVIGSATYRLQFTSLTPGPDGPALDNVRIAAVPDALAAAQYPLKVHFHLAATLQEPFEGPAAQTFRAKVVRIDNAKILKVLGDATSIDFTGADLVLAPQALGLSVMRGTNLLADVSSLLSRSASGKLVVRGKKSGPVQLDVETKGIVQYLFMSGSSSNFNFTFPALERTRIVSSPSNDQSRTNYVEKIQSYGIGEGMWDGKTAVFTGTVEMFGGSPGKGTAR